MGTIARGLHQYKAKYSGELDALMDWVTEWTGEDDEDGTWTLFSLNTTEGEDWVRFTAVIEYTFGCTEEIVG